MNAVAWPGPPPSEAAAGRPHGESVHATAVSIGRRGLVICGPSRSGKSRLALALIAASTRNLPIALVGDDRILLTCSTGRHMARPHPRIEGFVERRGLGIIAMRCVAPVPVDGVVTLGRKTSPPAALANLPSLSLVALSEGADLPELSHSVLRWWRGARTTHGRKPASGEASTSAKD